MRRVRIGGLAGLVLLSALTCSRAHVRAQESGGSFGGSAWDDPPAAGGGSSDWGSSGGSSDWGASSSAPADDWAERQASEQRAEEERRAEEARRAEEERRAEEAREEARRAEEARIAAERARILALEPSARVRAITWPATPPFAPLASPLVEGVDAPVATARFVEDGWVEPSTPTIGGPTQLVVGPWNPIAGIVVGVPFTFLLALFALFVTRTRWSQLAGDVARAPAPPRVAWGVASPRAPAVPPAGPAMRLSIAFDWTVRAQLQRELAAMATRFDLRTRPGLSAAAQALTTMLAPLAPAARYVSWELSTGDARTWFTTRANDLRARFRAELVRNEATLASPEYQARENEGQGLVVVTVLVAGKSPITAPPPRFDLDALSVAIARLGARAAGETVALEVIWSPAAENDRMSSYELEKLYPELQRIAEGVGARQCAYCKGPFATELGRCPSCGAPI